jgi:Acetyltransferase (GNAT) domain
MSNVVGVPRADRFPDSPAGRQAQWFLEHFASDGVNVTLEDVAEHMALPAPWTPSEALERLRTGDQRTFKVDKVVARSALEIDVTLDYGDGKPRKLSLSAGDQEPHRIVKLWWARAMADDIVIRPAVADDSAALTQLEVRAPMTLGAATKLVYDRGEDFLAFTRLMEDNACFVAERNGELLGIACGARHPVRVGDQIYTVMLLHHVRVPVEHRGLGLFSALNNHVFSAFNGPFDCAYGYRAVDNADANRIRGPQTWNAGVFRAVIDCAAVAGADHGRPVTPADAPAVIDILNRGHAREELYLPYTEASLTARLERAPDLYTWNHLRIGEGAVLGVWPAHLTVTIDDGTPVRTTRSVTLDHGFVDGAEVEFEQLLRAHCRELLRFDRDEVTFMTSEGSPNYELICKLARRMEPFAFHIELPEPPGTIERGLYIDAVYF